MGEFLCMEESWDLQAVVRGCTGAVGAGENSRFAPVSVAEGSFLFETAAMSVDELGELYKPFYPLSPQTILTSSISVPQELKNFEERKKQLTISTGSKVSQARDDRIDDGIVREVIKSKKSNKNQQKRVVQEMNEANLSSDMWAWRKYGQKPIKGSPYPRSYYRCSSSKGCLARKQVERNPLDPEVFIVTYTDEHSHAKPTRRNSLAGSTRNKSVVPKISVKEESQDQTIASPTSNPSSTSLENNLVQHRSVSQSVSDKRIADFEDDKSVLSPNMMMLRSEMFLGWDNIDELLLTDKMFDFDACLFD